MSDPPEHWPRAVEGIISSTLDAIGRPALKEIYNAAVGDRITEYRVTNLVNVFKKYQEETKDLPPGGRRFVAEKVGIRFIEEASLEADPALQEIWARLLAAAVSKSRPDVTTRYISVAKELTPEEALFLRKCYDHASKEAQPLTYSFKLVASPPWISREQIIDIAAHVISLGIAIRVEYKVRLDVGGAKISFSDANVEHLTSFADLDQVRLTKFGWEFVCAAIEGAAPMLPGKQQGAEPVRRVGKSRRRRTLPPSRD